MGLTSHRQQEHSAASDVVIHLPTTIAVLCNVHSTATLRAKVVYEVPVSTSQASVSHLDDVCTTILPGSSAGMQNKAAFTCLA